MKHGDLVKLRILKAGVRLWHKDPSLVSARKIAPKVDLTPQGVLYHFPNGLKNAVAMYAVEAGDSKVIVQLILTGSKYVKNLTDQERRKHIKSISD